MVVLKIYFSVLLVCNAGVSSPLSIRDFAPFIKMFYNQFATIAVVFGLVTFTLSFDYTGGDELYGKFGYFFS